MGGGLLQLVAHGAQDAYLTGNPQITFWKGLFKRHTNFAMEPFRINLTGMPMWGQKQSATLGRHADLAYSTYLSIVLPRTTSSGALIQWNNEQGRLGYNLLDYVEIEVGGQLIDRLYSEWLYLWDTLTSDYNTSFNLNLVVSGGLTTSGYATFPASTSCSVNAPTGRQSHPNLVHVPLPFFYTKNPGAALPLIALQYHEVKININWNKSQFVGHVGNAAPDNISGLVAPPAPTSVALYVDYIYLDVDERRRMAQESHEYLIEQVQFNEDKGVSAASNRIDLTFNHPVKELVWVVQPERFTNCKIDQPRVGGTVNATVGAPRPSQSRLSPFTYTYLNQSGVSAHTQPIFEQWLQINGQDRMDRRFGDYFNEVQLLQHHTGTMKPFGFSATEHLGRAGGSTAVPSVHQAIYSYSFALKPEEHQPSGTCNFSRIDTATIVLSMSGDYIIDEATDNNWNVRVYATNYNVLRIMSGMAGLAYSN